MIGSAENYGRWWEYVNAPYCIVINFIRTYFYRFAISTNIWHAVVNTMNGLSLVRKMIIIQVGTDENNTLKYYLKPKF